MRRTGEWGRSRQGAGQQLDLVRQRALSVLHADSAEWHLPDRLAFHIVAWAFLIALVPIVARIFPDLYRSILREDGPVEWLQFIALVVAVPVFAWLAANFARREPRWVGPLFFAAALGLVFVAGEEISWGQRIFKLTTPEELEEINRQRETNIHNIGSLLKFINVGTLTLTLIACTLPLLRWTVWKDRPRSLIGYALIPPMALIPLFGFAVAYRVVRLVFLPEPGFTVSVYQEAAELAFYLGIVIFAVLLARILRQSRASPAPGQPIAAQTIDGQPIESSASSEG